MKLYKCCECEKTFDSDKPLCNNKLRNGKICGSDDVIALKPMNTRTNEAYTDRLFREGQNQ